MAINTYFKNIADAIREKTGGSAFITPGQMPGEIRNIPTGGASGILECELLRKDYKGAYVSGSTYYPTETANLFTDIYKIPITSIAHRDFLILWLPYGTNRATAAYFNTNPLEASGNLSGIQIVNSSGTILDPKLYTVTLTNTSFIYVAVTKVNDANYTGGLDTHCYVIEG